MYSKKGDDNIKFLNYIAQTESSKINDVNILYFKKLINKFKNIKFVKAWQDVT